MTTHQESKGHWSLVGGAPVCRLGFGTMRLALSDPDAVRAVLRRAVELGIDHFDTAGFYFNGDRSANAILRDALHPYRDDLLIGVKVGPQRTPAGDWLPPATGEEIRSAVEQNLRELGLDQLDLVYLRIGGIHKDIEEPLADRFGVLAGLQQEGLIRHLGVSNVSAEELAVAQSVAPVAAVQNHFNLATGADRALLSQCERQGIAYVPFPPLGGADYVPDEQVEEIAERHAATVPQILLAWLLALAPNVLPIPGTSSLEHLEENFGATRITLTPEEVAALGAATS